MDLEVVGRHSLFFDDDAMAAFVNSPAALVDWNSLAIDRYDVRHLLSSPPPPFKRRRPPNQGRSSASPPPPELSSESELDKERFMDLPSESDEQDVNIDLEAVNDSSGYHSVGFSYGNSGNSTEPKDADAMLGHSGFHPPFPVPESLLQNLMLGAEMELFPPTEKVHHIIARTAIFVSKQGGQSEIVLRVKHGDNPTFGFLMPDHHLHGYFRFLVDNKEWLKLDEDGKSQEDENSQARGSGAGGALSLLGSAYGSGEDEDAPEFLESKSVETSDALKSTTHIGSEQADASVSSSKKDEMSSKRPLSSKERVTVSKRNGFNNIVKVGKKHDTESLPSAVVSKSEAFIVPTTTVETSVVEPPTDVKRVVDKIVEFIHKNGRSFESVLIEQDIKHGRFPFLVPSNKYHPYYLKVLQKTTESKVSGKKEDPVGHGLEKKVSLPKDSDMVSLGAAGDDIPYDSDRKEKFKMVIGKSKKDGQDQPSQSTQQQFGVSVDATAAAAILQAATRGIKYPNLGVLPKTSLNDSCHGISSDGGQGSSFGERPSSQLQKIVPKPDHNGDPTISVPVAKVIAKTAALAAASEADSSEACLTREQKVKAERLKRAKMFAAMIKGGAAPLKTETPRGLSAEPPESGVSGSGTCTQLVNVVGKEREGSSIPPDVNTADYGKHTSDEYSKRRSKRTYRSRTGRHEQEKEDDDDVDVDDDDEEEVKEEEEEINRKQSKKQHRSHHSSHSKDKQKHHKRRSSSKEKESRHRHKHNESSDDGVHHRRSSSHKHNESSDDKVHHRRNSSHKHDESSDCEDYHRRSYTQKYIESSDDEDRHRRSHKHKHIQSSDDEDHHRRNKRKHTQSSEDEDYHRRSSKHKHDEFSGDEDHHRRNSKRKHSKSSKDKDHHRRSTKHSKKSHPERELELEEGEINTRCSDQSKTSLGDATSGEASPDLSYSARDGMAVSQAPQSAEVSDDLRAKIRAMLLATL